MATESGDTLGAMSEPRRSQRRGVSPLLVLGVCVLVLALAGAGWAWWRYSAAPAAAEEAATQRITELRTNWQDGTVSQLESASTQWLLRIPALGEDWEWPVAVGVEPDSLADAVGWYPRTAQPGQIGNFALAGGCIAGAEPFRHLLDVATGDEVVVETRDAVHHYEIVVGGGELTVDAADSWVLDPVPGQVEAEPTQALITLTTCEDLYPTSDRMVLFGHLTATQTK